MPQQKPADFGEEPFSFPGEEEKVDMQEVWCPFANFAGWDLSVTRIRHLQLALEYLKFEEIEK